MKDERNRDRGTRDERKERRDERMKRAVFLHSSPLFTAVSVPSAVLPVLSTSRHFTSFRSVREVDDP